MAYNRPSGPTGRTNTMKLGYSLALFAGALAFVAGACEYPDFAFRTGAGATTTTSSGGSGGGGAAATAGTDAGGTSPGGTGGSGGTAGAPPVCTPLGQQGGCPADQKCTILDAGAGTLGCGPAGETPDFQACASNDECGMTSWCDDATDVCRPVCQDSPSCALLLGTGSVCAPTTQGGQPVTGGLQVCTAHCNPTSNGPCISPAEGVAVSCAWRSIRNDWDCVVSVGKGDGDDCAEGWECSPGLQCSASNTCQPWCTAPLGCCNSCTLCVCDASCEPLNPQLYHDGQEIGACYSAGEHFPPNGCC